MNHFVPIVIVAILTVVPAAADLEWTLGLGGNGNSLYQEANWIDPATGITPPAGAVNPNTAVHTTLRIRTGNPGGGAGAGGTLLMGSGELLVSRATLRMNRAQASGINMGATNQALTLIDGKILTQNVTNGNVVMQGRSELTLYGPNPLTNTTIDLQSADCFVFFLDRLPTAIDGTYLTRFTVNGAAAVLNSNVTIRQYYNGAVIRPTLPGGVALKAFNLPDLTGTKWNFNTGFKGRIGLGFTTHDTGTYTIAGWGADIWGTGDECHFAYRPLTGDGEIIAKVENVAKPEDMDPWAKAGVMIREDLSDGARNAFLFRRPDGALYEQRRTAPGGTTSSTPTAAAAWMRLTRVGNTFTSYYSTTGAAGSWTQAGTGTLNMPATVYWGLAVTSHLAGVERGTRVCSNVTILDGGVPVVPSGALGAFTATAEIEAAWARDDQISSFLLKKGYMVTVAEDGGGQGASRFYAATEADLLVNLPPELDNKVSFMRVLPWRWVAKKGWAGTNATHMTTIGAFWNYEWEPTGFSNLNREFAPMIKGRGQDKDFRWEEVRVRGGQTHFLGFNEPESVNQGDLSVAEAIALWPKAQQLGLRLGSPARTDGANGDNWLMQFMSDAATNGYRVDYVCVHNYNRKVATGPQSLKAWLDAEYVKYGLPIWLTEFQRDTNDDPTAAQHQTYLEQVLPMLESLPYLERYSYYNFSTVTPDNDFASLFNGDLTANAKGQLYADVFSNPGFRNTGQAAWATANLSLPGGLNIAEEDTGTTISASVSLDPSKVSSVQFFANGVLVGSDSAPPYELSLDSLGPGLHTIHAVITTNFGEQLVSPARQVMVTHFALLPATDWTTGAIVWSAIPGESYRLETSQTLESADWTLVEQRVATGFTETISDPAYGAPARRFYRIVWE